MVEMPNKLVCQFLVANGFDFGRIADVLSRCIANVSEIIKQGGCVGINQPVGAQQSYQQSKASGVLGKSMYRGIRTYDLLQLCSDFKDGFSGRNSCYLF